MINLPDVKTIGLKISGGTDSSLLAFLLANYIISNKLSIDIIPIIIIEEDAPFQEQFAKNVLSIVTTITGYNFNTARVFNHKSKTDKILLMRTIENLLKSEVDLIVSGTTQNPKSSDFNEPGGPDDNRIGIFPELWDDWIYTPFINYDKKEIAELYNKNNLMDVLFPYTRSCVTPTQDFSKHCGNCWWCKERMYGFGKL